MFSKLKNKWKVNWLQFALIICTFALGGSLCGYAGRNILSWIALERNLLYYIIYVIIITILWPIAVLMVSIPLGQFLFFKNYIKKIGKRMFGK